MPMNACSILHDAELVALRTVHVVYRDIQMDADLSALRFRDRLEVDPRLVVVL
jgi:hypothetical protein